MSEWDHEKDDNRKEHFHNIYGRESEKAHNKQLN